MFKINVMSENNTSNNNTGATDATREAAAAREREAAAAREREAREAAERLAYAIRLEISECAMASGNRGYGMHIGDIRK